MSTTTRNGNANGQSATADQIRPPHNIEVEESVIGAMVRDPGCIDDVAAVIVPDAFYRAFHVELAHIIFGLRSAGRSVDLISIFEECTRRHLIDRKDGWSRLSALVERANHSANAVYHAHIIRAKSRLRALMAACHQTLDEANRQTETADAIIEAAECRFLAIGEDRTGGPKLLRSALAEVKARMDARLNRVVAGVSTGLLDLDAKLGGCLPNGKLILVAGRPSMGKSALAMNVAEHAAINRATPTLFVSLEMSEGDLGERFVSWRSGVFGGRLKHPGALSPTELGTVGDVIENYGTVPLYIDDRPALSCMAIGSVARRARSAHGIGLLVVDYLQLIDGTGLDDARKSRQEVVAEISKRLKALSRELDVPLIAVCQLNRECEGRSDKRPMMSDLRESGSLEQDADIILLLHRPDYYDRNDSPGLVELNVAKNRNGETGMVRLKFSPSFTRFEDYTEVVPLRAADFDDEPF